MTWRGWAGFACIGCAGMLAWQHHWLAATGMTAAALPSLAWWVRGQLLATKRTLRILEEMSAVAERYARMPRPTRVQGGASG